MALSSGQEFLTELMTRAVQDALRETAPSWCFPESSSNGEGLKGLDGVCAGLLGMERG